MENSDKVLVLFIVLASAVITWKLVFDFYKTKLHKVFSHLIAVATSSFMFLSTMMLFVPENYQRGAGPDVEFSIMSLVTVVVMVFAIYLFFKYIPQSNGKKEEAQTKKSKK